MERCKTCKFFNDTEQTFGFDGECERGIMGNYSKLFKPGADYGQDTYLLVKKKFGCVEHQA